MNCCHFILQASSFIINILIISIKNTKTRPQLRIYLYASIFIHSYLEQYISDMLRQLIVDTPKFMAHWLSLTYTHIHICIYNICLTRFVPLDRKHPLTKRRGQQQKEGKWAANLPQYISQPLCSKYNIKKEREKEGGEEGRKVHCEIHHVLSSFFLLLSCGAKEEINGVRRTGNQRCPDHAVSMSPHCRIRVWGLLCNEISSRKDLSFWVSLNQQPGICLCE